MKKKSYLVFLFVFNAVSAAGLFPDLLIDLKTGRGVYAFQFLLLCLINCGSGSLFNFDSESEDQAMTFGFGGFILGFLGAVINHCFF